MTLLHVIRHGKASPDKANYDELHVVGQQQARLLGAYLGEQRQPFDAIYCGPLTRQLDTLRCMREAAGETGLQWPETRVLDGLAEAPIERLVRECMPERLPHDAELRAKVDAIAAVGADQAAVRRAIEALIDYVITLWADGVFARPGLESAAAFGSRVRDALSEILAQQAQASHVAVVTSNGVVGWLLAHVDGVGDPDRVGPAARLWNSSVTRLAVADGALRIEARNLLDHQPDPALRTFI